MARSAPLACRAMLAFCSLATSLAAQPATQPSTAGTVAGVVTAESEVPLSEMLVYLDAADPAKPPPTTSAPPAPVRVSQKGAQFAPRITTVTVGQSVEFLNDEDRPIEHNVFSNSPASRFDLGLYGPGKSKSVTFDKPGPVFLYCSIHRYMDGVVFVSPTPYTSRVDDTGNYQMQNVPPGAWIVKTWQRRRRFMEKSVPVTVETGKTATVNLELTKK